MKNQGTKKLNIGLLGFGSMGKTHLWAVKNLPFFYGDLPFDAEVVGVCTTSREKSLRVAKQYGISVATHKEEDLILNPEIDVIDVCTPNDCHFATVKKAILAGKTVFCEKPLCLTLEEAKELAALPLKKGQIAGMSFNYRWLPAVMRAKELVDAGALGRILSFQGTYFHSSATDVNKKAGWKQDAAVCGGGALYDLGSHVIDLLAFLAGRLTRVSGHSQIAYPVRTGRDGKPWETTGDENFILTGTTDEGALGSIRVGKIQVGTNDDLSFEIYGEKGALKFSLMNPNFLEYYDATLPEAKLGGNRGWVQIECVGRYPDTVFPSPKAPVGWLHGHLESIHSFLLSASEGKRFSPSFEEGLYVQSVLHFAGLSAKNHGVDFAVTVQ